MKKMDVTVFLSIYLCTLDKTSKYSFGSYVIFGQATHIYASNICIRFDSVSLSREN